ncbi:MAG: thioredoxin [Actinobacteria bacterium]|nr:thioredoxin [Actinomycetota bacterium]
MADLTTVTDQNFNAEVIDSDLPVLVDFWAEWCHPCRLVEPAVKQIAEENPQAIKVVKLNIDENPDIASRYGVMSIPTLMLFKEGVEKARVIGARPKEAILSEIGSFMNGGNSQERTG